MFVRQNSIEIKEICKHGEEGKENESSSLQDIAMKNDFDSPIRAARIFGLPRSYPQYIKVDDHPITKEEGYMLKPEPEAILRPELPPHIMALTLESMKLVFLCAFHDDNGDVQFLSSYRILSAGGETSHSRQLGEHIAVDPKSRALAVAANEGSFYLYALKGMADLREEFTSADDPQDTTLDPIIGASISSCFE